MSHFGLIYDYERADITFFGKNSRIFCNSNSNRTAWHHVRMENIRMGLAAKKALFDLFGALFMGTQNKENGVQIRSKANFQRSAPEPWVSLLSKKYDRTKINNDATTLRYF